MVRTHQKMNGVLRRVHALARRFWFWSKVFNRAACQTLAQKNKKMNVILRKPGKGERSRNIAFKNWCRDSVFAKTFQRDLAPKNGAFAPKNERGVTLRSKIGTQILIFAKSFQSGRVPEFGTNVPKNERSVTACDSIRAVLIMFLIATDLAGNTNTNSNKYIRLLTTAKRYGIIE